MKPSFKLEAHPRRPHPALSGPPAGYFDKLPSRIMARLPEAETRTAWRWLGLLSPAWRTGLASVAVLGGFAASFLLSGTPPQVATVSAATTALDAVPRTELVGYLLTSDAHVETSDLAALTATNPNIGKGFLHASAEELNAALDAQPADEASYL